MKETTCPVALPEGHVLIEFLGEHEYHAGGSYYIAVTKDVTGQYWWLIDGEHSSRGSEVHGRYLIMDGRDDCPCPAGHFGILPCRHLIIRSLMQANMDPVPPIKRKAFVVPLTSLQKQTIELVEDPFEHAND